MTSYDGYAPDGTCVRVRINDDGVAYLYTLAPGDHSTWSRPLELTRTDDQ